ncbi:MAG: adenylate/guanylate cyclase domain-containing protein [Deltaproteobacteria bacterium]|nr:adenylate/guanylate cyclase domain-containing protein [Deltaproteobacteria bacterium]
MPLITYLPDQKTLESAEGETLLQAALRAKIPLTNVCGGSARCSTCRVSVVEGREHCSPRTPEEQGIAEMLLLPAVVRLACQTIPTGPVKVRRLVEELEDVDFDTLYIREAEPCTIGEEKEVLILFCDIQGFTPFAESLLPYDVVYSLNLFLRQMGEIVGAYGGSIDNYLGDGFMALFEADDCEAAALQAVGAGLAMLQRVQDLGPYLLELYQRSFQIRLGLHYGKVVAGRLGHPRHKRMTVIGDAVNFASRIENANKKAGTRFLVSHDVYDLVKGRVQVGKRVYVTLQGKTGKHRLFEIIGLRSESV